jgi:hypothetical protein
MRCLNSSKGESRIFRSLLLSTPFWPTSEGTPFDPGSLFVLVMVPIKICSSLLGLQECISHVDAFKKCSPNDGRIAFRSVVAEAAYCRRVETASVLGNRSVGRRRVLRYCYMMLLLDTHFILKELFPSSFFLVLQFQWCLSSQQWHLAGHSAMFYEASDCAHKPPPQHRPSLGGDVSLQFPHRLPRWGR